MKQRKKEKKLVSVNQKKDKERCLLHYKLSAAERTVTGRAICLIISCCGF